jgi:hypothetical protein
LAAVGETQVSVRGFAADERQKRKCEKHQKEKKRSKESEEENGKGNEKGKAATEKRDKLGRFC